MKILNPGSIRRAAQAIARKNENVTEINPKLWGAVIGHLNAAGRVCHTRNPSAHVADQDAARRLVFGWLFNQDGEAVHERNSEKLTPAQKSAVIRWVGSTKDTEGNWVTRAGLVSEFSRIFMICAASLVENDRRTQAAEPWATIGQILQSPSVDWQDYDAPDTLTPEASSMPGFAVFLGGVIVKDAPEASLPVPATRGDEFQATKQQTAPARANPYAAKLAALKAKKSGTA